MKKIQKTYHLLILDRSGSMSDCTDSTISGFNEQIRFIQSLPLSFPKQQFFVSLVLFNHEIDEIFSGREPGIVPLLNRQSYVPKGSTKLLDAIGRSVESLKENILDEIESGEATAIVSILTDGYENSSLEYDYEGIRKMITGLEKSGKWTFTFLGADIDAIAESSKMGIRENNAMSFSKSALNETFGDYNSAMHNYANKKSKGKGLLNFFEKEEDDEKDKW